MSRRNRPNRNLQDNDEQDNVPSKRRKTETNNDSSPSPSEELELTSTSTSIEPSSSTTSSSPSRSDQPEPNEPEVIVISDDEDVEVYEIPRPRLEDIVELTQFVFRTFQAISAVMPIQSPNFRWLRQQLRVELTRIRQMRESFVDDMVHSFSAFDSIRVVSQSDFETVTFETIFKQTMDQKHCTICLSTFEETDVLRRPRCLHIFHPQCLQEWLRRSSSCPVCRINVWE